MFTNHKGTSKNAVIFEGSVENSVGTRGSFVFRAIDSKQIGGIGNFEEYSRFTRRLLADVFKEVDKNKRGIGLMRKEGLMPNSFF